MQEDLGEEILRPQVVRRLIQQHLDPLLPNHPPSYLVPTESPTWAEIDQAGRTLSEIADDLPRQSVAELLTLLPLWSKGARPTKSAQNYCELCWRHTLHDKKFCADHDQQISPSGYRRGHRLKPHFHTALQKLRAAEQNGICRSAWHKVLTNPTQLIAWLTEHRPRTYGAMPGHQVRKPFGIRDLLTTLDRPDAEASIQSLSRERRNLHALILEHPDQLFGMLRRCEAWHLARSKKPHGGTRPNAGRKPTKR